MTVTNVAVVGAGRMGQGIVAALAFGRVRCTLIDLRERGEGADAYLDKARAAVRDSLERKIDLGLLDRSDLAEVLDRISYVTAADAGQALAEADLVFEGVPEVREFKQEAFTRIEGAVAADVPIASTTSSILVTELAGMFRHPERFLNAHWLNPADLMPLVEVSPSDVTDDRTIQVTKDLLVAVGKVPVMCGATPGYIVPRLQALVMNEAARMVAEGVGTAEEIDRAVRIGFGARFAVLGLLEFIDWGGCDILFHASNSLRRDLGERFAPADLVEEHMTSGRRGLADGDGFYRVDPDQVDAYRTRRTAEFASVLDAVGHLHPYRPRAVSDTGR